MSYFVYILENSNGRFYTGHTDDLKRRLDQHNSSEGKSHLGKYTHKNGPWKVVWQEEHTDRASAMRREKQIKSWKSSRYIREHLLAQ